MDAVHVFLQDKTEEQIKQLKLGKEQDTKAGPPKGQEEEEEEEEDLFVFNDTIEGPRAPAVKPGRVTQA